jgi:hypothetical protein
MNFLPVNQQYFGASKPGADGPPSASQGQAAQDWSSFRASLEESMDFRGRKKPAGSESSLNAMRETSPQQAKAGETEVKAGKTEENEGDRQRSGESSRVAASVQSLAAVVELAEVNGEAGTLAEAAGQLETLIEKATEMNPAIEKLVQRILQAASQATGAEGKLNAATLQGASSAGTQAQPGVQAAARDQARPEGRLRGAEARASAGDRPLPQVSAEGVSPRPARDSASGGVQPLRGDRSAEATAGKPAPVTTAAARAQVSPDGTFAGASARAQSESSAPAAAAAVARSASRAEPFTPPTASTASVGSAAPQTAAGAPSGGAPQSFSDASFSGFGHEGKGRQDGRESHKSGGSGETFGVERSAGPQAAGPQGKAAPAPAQVSQTMQRIVESIQTLQQQAHQSRINLSVDLKNGESLRVSLQIVKQQVKVVFSNESEAMRIALRESWDQLQKQVLQKGLDADLPEFEGEERDPRQEMAGQNEDGGTSAAFSGAEQKPLAGKPSDVRGGATERAAVRPEASLAPESGIRRYA